jgi:hypothetical protein
MPLCIAQNPPTPFLLALKYTTQWNVRWSEPVANAPYFSAHDLSIKPYIVTNVPEAVRDPTVVHVSLKISADRRSWMIRRQTGRYVVLRSLFMEVDHESLVERLLERSGTVGVGE